MNTPPADATFVPVEALQRWLRELFLAVPIPAEHATLIAELMIDTDLRGVTSHGVVQVQRYVRGWQEGRTNRTPQIEVLQQGPATAALNGDGGLGYIVAAHAMEMAIERAETVGVGIVTTTHHDHIGSAGKYVRMALRRGHIGVGLSGRNAAPSYDPSSTIMGSIQGSPPFCVGVPSGPKQPPFLLDMATHIPWDEATFARMPQIYLKAIGISHVANMLSGTLGGQMLPRFDRRNITHSSADQSGFFMALQVERFTDPAAFLGDMDHLMQQVGDLQPLPGFDLSDLPGGPEWRTEANYRETGIPIGADTLAVLTDMGTELGVAVPWRRTHL
ncbi:MAG: Ldh family oxidoreductase [bacterium]|nr:Ldh family oxidoreductase [bacterium]